MPSRNFAIDFLKLVAILGVVIIHTSTAFIDNSIPFSFQFDVLVFINQIFRFSVPLFFAASGIILTLIYSKKMNVSVFYKRRLLRILPSYTFWFFVYYFFVFPHPILNIFKESFYISFLYGEASYQLYFIPIIIILYILFPVFLKFKDILLTKSFLTLLGVTTVIFLSFVYYANFTLTSVSPIRGTLYNLFPFLLGMYAGLHYEKLSKFLSTKRNKTYVITALSGILLFLETLLLFALTSADRFLREQWRFTVVLYSVFASISLFNLYNSYFINMQKPIERLSKLSFGVFFIHVLILNLALDIITSLNAYNLMGFLLTVLGTITISFAVVYILSRMPIIGKVLSAT